MKRSEINGIMRAADAFFRGQGFYLPPFAYWSPQDWKKKGEEVAEIVDRRLGWDITDFGRGKFCKCGLAIFTLRNGNPADLPTGKGKLYAEKILMFKHDQVCPFHFHWHKMEDIINRGGGDLYVQVYNSNPEEGVADTPVTLSKDGTRTVFDAGTPDPAAARRERDPAAYRLPQALGLAARRDGRRGLAGQRRRYRQPLPRAGRPLRRHRGGRAADLPAARRLRALLGSPR